MLPMYRYCGCAALVLEIVLCVQSAASGQPVQSDEDRQRRLDFMKRKLEEFSLYRQSDPDTKLAHTPDPVLRFSNPVRNSFSDGAIFLWLDDKRPRAAASLWIRANGNTGYDFTSLTDAPLTCIRDGQTVWAPPHATTERAVGPDAPAPTESERLRLTQMRDMARRFSGTIQNWPSKAIGELRLLPQPIYRYAAPKEDIVDGAIFALAQANDPEILVVLELVDSSPKDAKWHYLLARRSAVRMEARLDDREILSLPGYGSQPRTEKEPYIEARDGDYTAEGEPKSATEPQPQ